MKRLLSALLLCLTLVACATTAHDTAFRRQFDHFYPDDPRYVTRMYRDAYLQIMADPAHFGDLGLASTADPAALHRYLLRASTESLDGERGETYAYDLRFLLIRVGDAPFAAAFHKLPPKQREAAASFFDGLILRERDWFPQTTASYAYRYCRLNPNAHAHR